MLDRIRKVEWLTRSSAGGGLPIRHFVANVRIELGHLEDELRELEAEDHDVSVAAESESAQVDSVAYLAVCGLCAGLGHP